MGSVKFVLAIIDSISPQKMGVNFFSAKLDTKGEGGRGGPRALFLMPQNLHVFIFEFFPYTQCTLNIMATTLHSNADRSSVIFENT